MVNVEPFHVLGVVVVGCPEHFDGVDVVSKRVEFGEVESALDTEINKDVLILMESFEGLM